MNHELESIIHLLMLWCKPNERPQMREIAQNQIGRCKKFGNVQKKIEANAK